MSKLIQSLVFLSIISYANSMENDYFSFKEPQSVSSINTGFNPQQTVPNSFNSFPFFYINNSFNQNNNNIFNKINNENYNIDSKLPSNNIQVPNVLQDLYKLYSNNNSDKKMNFDDTETFKNILYNSSHSILDTNINTWNEFISKCICQSKALNNDKKYIKTNLSESFNKNEYKPACKFISDNIINNNSVGKFGVISSVNNSNISIYDYLKYEDKQKLGKIKYENMNTIYGLEKIHFYKESKNIIDNIHNYLQNNLQNNSFNSNDAVVLLNNIVRPIYYYFLIQSIYNFMSDFMQNSTNYSVEINIPQQGGILNDKCPKLQLEIKHNSYYNDKNILILTFDCSTQTYEITAIFNRKQNNNKQSNKKSLFGSGLFDFN